MYDLTQKNVRIITIWAGIFIKTIDYKFYDINQKDVDVCL